MLDQPATIRYAITPAVSNAELDALFAAAWPAHTPCDFAAQHQHSLAFVCAYDRERLVGYVNLAWNGGIHAFVLDTSVHPAYQRRGIGRALLQHAADVARARGMHWLHVDYESHLAGFYAACGFVPTPAGLLRLNAES
jgi:GNAT superfamily N-acetyltransferase